MCKRAKMGGFTLVEVMIVVLVMAMLLMIAVPNFVRARDTARINACLKNLRLIENAKVQYSMERSTSSGDPVSWDDIVPTFLKSQPSCPSGGVYKPEPVGASPSCPISGHEL